MQRFSSICAVMALAATATAQFNITIPNGYAAVEGSTSNAFPWGRGGSGILMQCVYDSSHFTAQGITYPILIQGLKWRPNTNVALVATTFPTPCSIRCSTSPVDQSLVTTTFANQRGADETLCFQGPVSFPAQPAVAGPTPFGISVPFTTNFLYDPSLGDLNIETDLPIQTGYVGGTPQLDVHGVAGQANASRVYWTTGYAGGYPGGVATGITLNHAVVVEVTYVPAAGLYPSFTATPTSGPIGQLVNFTDSSYTSDPGGITSYAWDVNGDSITDYTTQNCAHVYNTEGNYNVSLTVTSAQFGTQTFTRTGYVKIDAVDAAFTASVVTGTVVQFTDTSTGGPTSWQWDFDNDGIVDSNLQNPVHVYPLAGQYTCKLTVSDAFSTDNVTTNIGVGIIPVPGFGSTFSSTAATRGFWFQAPTRFSIISATVPNEFGETLQNAAIYRLASAPPVFSATATGGLEFAGIGQPAGVPMPCVVSFDAGEYVGVLGACGSTTMRNSYATPVGPYASSVLGVPTTLTRMGTQFNIATAGPNQAYWQEPAAAISRVILGVTACAAIPYGVGSPSGLGPTAPTMKATALPYVGQTATHEVTQGDASVLQLMAGGFGRIAVPLPPFGTVLIGSLDYLDVMNLGAVVGPGTTAWNFNVPNSATLVGASVNFQNINLVIPTGEWSMSNAIEWWIDV